jgi:hypothetical protein
VLRVPWMTCLGCAVLGFHTRSVASSEAVRMSLPSGENPPQVTGPAWPTNMFMHSPAHHAHAPPHTHHTHHRTRPVLSVSDEIARGRTRERRGAVAVPLEASHIHAVPSPEPAKSTLPR